jgi:putative cardiolipin synthase
MLDMMFTQHATAGAHHPKQAPSSSLWPFFIVLTLVVSGCSSLPKDVARTPSYAIDNTSGTQIAAAISPLLDAHPGQSGFHALSKGTEAFGARIVLVEQAQETLDVQYYIWHDDLTGRTLHNRLLAAADRGVRVRILLDDLDTAGKEQMLHTIDLHPNIEIRLFNPFSNRGARGVDFVTDTRRVNHRMHNKTLTADNQATIFGGRNIGDEYFDAAEEVGFSDLDALAVGPVAQEISGMFDLYWNSQWVYPLAAFEPPSPVDQEQLASFRQQSDADLQRARETEYAAALRDLGLASSDSIADIAYQWGRWILVYDQPGKVDAKKVSIETHMGPKLKKAMDHTENELIIVSPYFVPGKTFTQYLVGLVDKGVRVRILTNSLAANDVSMVHAGYMRYRSALIEGGVELFEFKSDKSEYVKDNKDSGNWTGSENASLHGKYFAFDQRYVFIGSFNLDGRSVALNTELGVYFESPVYAQEISNAFDQKSLVAGYQVILNEDGDMEWLTLKDGKEVRLDKEPDTTFWQRFSTGFISIVVPESQL